MSELKRRDSKGRLLQTGECQRTDGSYMYRYMDADGNRKVLSSWRLTKADVTPPGKKHKPSLREQEQELQKMLMRGSSSHEITVCEQVAKYLLTKLPKETHNTAAGYKTVQKILDKHPFGEKKIGAVKYSDALTFLVSLQNEGKGYSSIQNIRGVLRPAFEMAFRDELIPSNPFAFPLGDALINDSVKREAISPENERKFLEFVKNDKHFSRYYEGIYILFKTGLRISEFCGLTISDINFNEHTINIDHQLQRERNGKYIIINPKTDAGKRVLPMRHEVEECLKKIIQNRKSPKIEPIIDGHTGFLYFDKDGKPMIAMHWEKYFQHICEKYNKIHRVQMPKVTPHVCRHTYCSNMARSGINAKTLQYLMGHSDITVTLDVYTHLGLEDAKKEIAKIERANGRKAANC